MYFVPESPVATTITDCRSMSGPFINVIVTGPLFPCQVMVNGSLGRITYSSFVKTTAARASVARCRTSNSVIVSILPLLPLLAVAVLCDNLPHNCGEQKEAAAITSSWSSPPTPGKKKDEKFNLN